MSRSRRWRKNTALRKEARAHLHSSGAAKMEGKEEDKKTDYTAWSHEKLIERVTQLEVELKANNKRYKSHPRSCPSKFSTDEMHVVYKRLLPHPRRNPTKSPAMTEASIP